MEEVSTRFRVISTAWFELGRLPYAWWPRYLLNKAAGRNHWSAGRTVLLSHPRCHLSFRRQVLDHARRIRQSIASRQLTVLVAHWWEFFRDQQPDEAFIGILHELAGELAESKDIRLVPFQDVAEGKVPLN